MGGGGVVGGDEGLGWIDGDAAVARLLDKGSDPPGARQLDPKMAAARVRGEGEPAPPGQALLRKLLAQLGFAALGGGDSVRGPVGDPAGRQLDQADAEAAGGGPGTDLGPPAF